MQHIFMGVPPGFWVSAAGVAGLVVGSFLNVVIFRLPVMLENAWKRDAQATLHPELEPPTSESFNLLHPHSRCNHCGHAIRWWE
ncbi:MAG: prepilin peptidase, partial [Betaproteobacteria bacterium]|nr:prepilin peptidase [Betaproteobacteria bacterium]